MGMGLYWVTLAGTFLLVAQIWQKGAWKDYPAFFAYLMFCGVRAVILWPVLYRGNQALYNERAWYLQIVAIPFLAAAVGELFKSKWAGAFLGAMAAGCLTLVLGQIRLLISIGQRPAAIELAKEFRLIVAVMGMALAVVILLAMRKSAYRVGLLIATGFGAIALLIRSTGPERYLGTAAWMVALILWLGWFGQYRPEAKRRYSPDSSPRPARMHRSYHGYT